VGLTSQKMITLTFVAEGWNVYSWNLSQNLPQHTQLQILQHLANTDLPNSFET